MYRKRRDRNRRRRYMPRTFTAKAAKATCPRIRRGFPTSLSYLRSSTKFFSSPFSYFQRSRLLLFIPSRARANLCFLLLLSIASWIQIHPTTALGQGRCVTMMQKKRVFRSFLLLLGRTNMISTQRAIKSQSQKSSRPLSHARRRVSSFFFM